MPPIKFVSLPPPRELVIVRRKTHDFGFSLRNAIVLDRSESLFIPTSKSVIFAEPGASASNGLLPGDRLIKVNRTPVEKVTREAIIEMIRNSGDKVIVEVQPVAELVELSRRCMPKEDSAHDEIDKMAQVSDCNTLRRSASKRFKQVSDFKFLAEKYKNEHKAFKESPEIIEKCGLKLIDTRMNLTIIF